MKGLYQIRGASGYSVESLIDMLHTKMANDKIRPEKEKSTRIEDQS
jgi:hypothetical protein